MSTIVEDEYVSATPSPARPVQTKLQQYFTPEKSSIPDCEEYVPSSLTPAVQKKHVNKRHPAARRKLTYPPLRVRRVRARKVDFRNALYRVLRAIDNKGTISSKAMTVMNDMMGDLMERLAKEAGSIAERNRKATLSVRDVQTATRVLLPDQLAHHAFYEAHKAVHAFFNATGAQ